MRRVHIRPAFESHHERRPWPRSVLESSRRNGERGCEAFGSSSLGKRNAPTAVEPAVKFSHYEYDLIEVDNHGQMVNVNEMTHNSFFFGPKEIESLKRQAVGKGGEGAATFEVLSACLWRSRTRALQLPAEQEVRFIFPVDARKIFDPPLPEGFYGNAFALACAKTTARELANTSLSFAVKLINEAKTAVNNEYMRSVIDFMELNERPHFTMLGSFVASQVSKMGLRDVDFGWGNAVYRGPARGGLGAVDGMFLPLFHASKYRRLRRNNGYPRLAF